MITSSKFYKELNKLEVARKTGIGYLKNKGFSISEEASIPSIIDRIPSINTTAPEVKNVYLQGDRGIICAERPNKTMFLINKETKEVLAKKDTPENGGTVFFPIEEDGSYFIACGDAGVEPIFSEVSCSFEDLNTKYPFKFNQDTQYYETSEELATVSTQYSLCKLTFTFPENCTSLHIEVFNYGKRSKSYAGFGKLDTTMSKSYSMLDAEIYKTFSGFNTSGRQYVNYNNIEPGEHFVCAKYRKESIVDSLEGLKFKVLVASNVEWIREVELNKTGATICYSGKNLNEYTYKEIYDATVNGYFKDMFKLRDFIVLESFMGSTSLENRTAYYIGKQHDEKATGGKNTTTFMIKRTSSTYRHTENGVSNNGVSWIGSLIRQNGLRVGDEYYVHDTSANSSTNGERYVYDAENKQFLSKMLPEDYEQNVKYYTKHAMNENGAFWDGLPESIKPYICQVKKKTWAGYGGTVANLPSAFKDKTIIETKDWIFLPSDCEIFGNIERNAAFGASKYDLEGEQYEVFKEEYSEDFFSNSGDQIWTRSPNTNSASNGSFFYWGGGTSSGNFSYISYKCPPCFCIG